MNKPNPDDRRDNASKIKRDIANTKDNIRETNERIAVTDDPQTVDDLKSKNRRRGESLLDMNTEVKQEEAYNRKHDY